MRRTVQLILAGVLCLDLAYKSSVDAFLPAPTLLRGSLARQRSHVVASYTKVTNYDWHLACADTVE
jgi:hypothetical protein